MTSQIMTSEFTSFTSFKSKINPDNIDDIVNSVSDKVNEYQVSVKFLTKFSSSKIDQAFLSYLEGTSGIGYYMKFLASIIKQLGLTNIVELGNREGMSTIAIYDSLPDNATFSTIDIVKDQRYCPDIMFKDPRVNFIFGDVSDIEIIKQIPMDIELLFSDTIHYNFQITDEFEVYQHFLADTALFAIDDIHLNDKGLFWDNIHYKKWDLTKICHTSGWGLFMYERKNKLSIDERKVLAYEAAAKIWKRKNDELEKKLDKTFIYKTKKIKDSLKKWIRLHPVIHTPILKIKKILGFIR